MSMLREEIRQIVQASVAETLTRVGFTIDDPTATQRDMIYLRRTREGHEETALWVKRSAIGVCVTASLYLIWDALSQALTSH